MGNVSQYLEQAVTYNLLQFTHRNIYDLIFNNQGIYFLLDNTPVKRKRGNGDKN